MKKLVKWFVEFTKDSSTETKKWEKIIFRSNVLISWFGYLFAIIAVCGLCLTSCTDQEAMKNTELKVHAKIDELECGQSISLIKSEYGYLFKRLNHQNGIVEFGEVNYNVWNRKDDVYILTDQDYDKAQDWHLLVNINISTPLGAPLHTMNVRKVCGSYYYPIEVDGFELNLLKYDEDGYITIYIKNISGSPFAYAEQTQLNSNSVTDDELIFVETSTCQIKIRDISRLILYEYEGNDDTKRLKKKSYIPYLADLFRL
ncbi:hypothetical protein K9M48_01015 [Candidatus Gracilibacteria bacterium]|nr:hypothetical protein [Candidatus Gracilibacteria bacterium]